MRRRIVDMLAAAMAALPAAAAAAAEKGGFAGEMPEQGSTVAPQIDFAMNFINAVTVFFFILIIALMVFFAIRYRRRDPTQRAEAQTSHNTTVELGWTLPPLVIVLYMFWLGFSGFMRLETAPPDAYEVQVAAQKWSWLFTHPNGVQDTHLHVPAGEPVRLTMQSQDVIHSLFIPAFRVKKDVVPGRYNTLWFEALEPTPYADDALPDSATDEQRQALEQNKLAGGHTLFCTEFCGTQHSTMLARVIVHEPGWRPQGRTFGEEPSVEEGQYLFQIHACYTCHQTEPGGGQLAGPTFAGGILGRQETLQSGESITVDEEYIRESIRMPAAKVVQSFAPAMPAFDSTRLSDKQIDSIILYIRSLGEDAEGESEAAPQETQSQG